MEKEDSDSQVRLFPYNLSLFPLFQTQGEQKLQLVSWKGGNERKKPIITPSSFQLVYWVGGKKREILT